MSDKIKKSWMAVLGVAALSLTHVGTAAAAVTFGTDANGNAITWNHTAIPGGPAPAGAVATVNGSGELELSNTGGSAIDHEVQISSGSAFGSNTNGTPWIQVSWIDNNTSGTVPNIDFFATDTRAGKLSNRVSGGSLFSLAAGSGTVGVAKYNNPGTIEEYDQSYLPGSRAAINTSVPHTLRIGKDSTGLIHFEFDGQADASPSDVFSVDAGLALDHSVWDTLELRVRGNESGETFTFTSLTMGDDFTAVPEPAAIGLLGIGAAALLLRRRRRSA